MDRQSLACCLTRLYLQVDCRGMLDQLFRSLHYLLLALLLSYRLCCCTVVLVVLVVLVYWYAAGAAGTDTVCAVCGD